MVCPNPGSSFTSNTTPFAGPSANFNLVSKYLWVSPASNAKRSAMPSPVFAETGTIATVLVKSFILS